MMNNWVSNMGFPVVSISETEKRGTYKVSQRRFFSFGEPTPEEDAATWTINLGVCSSGNPEKVLALNLFLTLQDHLHRCGSEEPIGDLR